ncbi:S1 family peptidase [Streptosporangium sp. NPDC048865]|uniref:S1 family peptidase n=1 Tax=Streptosporangium sp. NPDC048865 TaxID=3155766 RepID=UPI00342A5E04
MVASVLAAHPVRAVPSASAGRAAEQGVATAAGRAAGQAVAARKPPLGMLEALQRDLGLTARQAQDRLLNEVRLTPVAARLHRRLGDRFAGAWLLEPTAQTLVVATTGRDDIAQIISEGALPLIVDRSLATLEQVKEKLNDAVPALSAVSSVRYVDARTNKVVILTNTPKAAERIVQAAGVDPAAVQVTASAERPRLLRTDRRADAETDLVGGQAYYVVGLRVRCSVGFSVLRGTRRGFVGAGHCGRPGNATLGFNRLAQGTVRASKFPGADHSWIEVRDTWRPRPLVGNDTGGTMRVYGARPAIEGSSACLSGSSSTGLNWYCGTVAQRDVDVTYSEGVVGHLIRLGACGHPGDSGASVISVDQAQGVVSGGSGTCADSGVTYVQPIGEILTAHDLTLMTNDTTPVASTGGCGGYPHMTDGTLGSAQFAYQPDGLYYRTTVTGDHYGCLQSDAGSDYDLYLQKQSGSSWHTVASSDSPNPLEELGYLGTPGYYRYMVRASSGYGPYKLGYTAP